MYPMSLSLKTDEDIKKVSDHVAGLAPVRPEPLLEGGDPEKGKAYYAACGACHGPKGEGNKALNSPPLKNTSDWYLATQLLNYKAGIRGGNPEDKLGVQMRGMSFILPDEQAIKDVIAHIMALPN